MKIVLVKNIEYDFDSVIISDSGVAGLDDEYVQMSETIDVDFPMLSDVDLNSKKIDAIDKKIAKAEAGIYLLEQTKAELLAIPDMRAK